MNRAINFRVWIPSRKFMGKSWTLFRMLTDIHEKENWFDCFPNEAKFMQYTGIDDKYGKPIYENDILFIKTPGWDSEIPAHDEVTKVEWIGGGFYPFNRVEKEMYHFEQNDPGMVLSDCLWKKFDGYSVEILGNIYENRELLSCISEN